MCRQCFVHEFVHLGADVFERSRDGDCEKSILVEARVLGTVLGGGFCLSPQKPSLQFQAAILCLRLVAIFDSSRMIASIFSGSVFGGTVTAGQGGAKTASLTASGASTPPSLERQENGQFITKTARRETTRRHGLGQPGFSATGVSLAGVKKKRYSFS